MSSSEVSAGSRHASGEFRPLLEANAEYGPKGKNDTVSDLGKCGQRMKDHIALESAACSAADDLVAALLSSSSNGLSSRDAKARIDVYGCNELPDDPKTPLWKLVLEQFKDRLVIILLLAALVSFALALLEVFSPPESTEGALFSSVTEISIWDNLSVFVEPLVIILILIANATVGVVQESNAENAIEALKSYASTEATVLRDGNLKRIPAKNVVPGDVIEVAVGDLVSADARVLSVLSTTLRVDQAVFTGESVSVSKRSEHLEMRPDASFVKQDMTNILFSGTTVTVGRARAIVVATGRNTAIGDIHQDIRNTDNVRSPLKKKLDDFGDLLARVITVICVLVWLINIRHFGDSVHHGWLRGAVYYFKIAVALAVAAIPEGLAVVITTCLALGTKRMARNNAIVRTLSSVETLGCTSVICSDKTGTLTTNMMTVRHLAFFSAPSAQNVASTTLCIHRVSGDSYDPDGCFDPNYIEFDSSPLQSNVKISTDSFVKELALEKRPSYAMIYPCARIAAVIGALCNSTTISFCQATQTFKCVGEPTEGALCILAEKLATPFANSAQELHELRKKNSAERASAVKNWYHKHLKVLKTFDFSRTRKSMSVVVGFKEDFKEEKDNSKEGRVLLQSILPNETLLVKGAPESVLRRCSRVMLGDGTTVELDDSVAGKKLRARVEDLCATLARQHALRLIALAYADLTSNEGITTRATWKTTVEVEDFEVVEQNLTFVGLAAMQDPPRLEVASAIKKCTSAGIRVIVVTGDNKDTAESVCREIGLFEPFSELSTTKEYEAVTGQEWSGMSHDVRARAASRVRLFARVEPSHKKELVEYLQNAGHVVAMTGDGVNDAPALRKADIGVAMGSGTDVAKHAADMVLADNNFSTIVSAVREGRSIYDNTKQFIRYLISSNIGEVVAIFLTVLLGMPEALIPVQLLWVNLVTDGLPATALGFNPPDDDIMDRAPRNSNDNIVTPWLFFRYLVIGCYVGAATVAGYAWWYMFCEIGPKVSWTTLTSHSQCNSPTSAPGCEYFAGVDGALASRHASTMSLSILVTIEMLNAMNSVSENASLLTASVFRNLFLVVAIVLSMALHIAILYVPFLAKIFNAAPLGFEEWIGVLMLSFPVLILDEMLKAFSRKFQQSGKL